MQLLVNELNRGSLIAPSAAFYYTENGLKVPRKKRCSTSTSMNEFDFNQSRGRNSTQETP